MAPTVEAVRALLPPLQGGWEDLLLPLYQGLVLIVLRVIVEAAVVPPLRAYLKPRARARDPGSKHAKSPDERAREVVENAFLVALIAPLSIWGYWVVFRANGPCTPLAPAGCLAGWPAHPVTPAFRWWWLSVGGLYAAEMIGTGLGGVGFKLSKEMVIHHIVTIMLMLFGYFGGFHRYGAMATAVLDTSNTFLHAAKAVHATGLPALDPLSDALFKSFAAVFFLVRVVAPPYSMLWPGFVVGWQVLPVTTYCITNGLMVIIYGLQLMWFAKIVKIATGGGGKEKTDGGAAAAAAGAVPPPQAALAGAGGAAKLD